MGSGEEIKPIVGRAVKLELELKLQRKTQKQALVILAKEVKHVVVVGNFNLMVDRLGG